LRVLTLLTIGAYQWTTRLAVLQVECDYLRLEKRSDTPCATVFATVTTARSFHKYCYTDGGWVLRKNFSKIQ
jgi:hypothetical protein